MTIIAAVKWQNGLVLWRPLQLRRQNGL